MSIDIPCRQCLRSVICLCTNSGAHTFPSRLEQVRSAFWSLDNDDNRITVPKWGHLLSFGLVFFVLLRVLGYVTWPVAECVAVAVALVDLAPLSRRELAIEAALLALLIKSLPVFGWRIALVTANALMGALILHCLLAPSVGLGRIGRVDVVSGVLLMCCAAVHMPANDGVGFASSIAAYLLSLVAVRMTDVAHEDSDKSMPNICRLKFIRAVGLSMLAQRIVLDTGFVFALRLKQHNDEPSPSTEGEASLDDVDKEFDSIPQHLSAVALVVAMHLFYVWSNVPVALFVAIGVLAHATVVAWGETDSDGAAKHVDVVHLRSRYDVAPFTRQPWIQLPIAYIAQRIGPCLHPSSPFTKPIAAASTVLLWLAVCFAFILFTIVPRIGVVGIGTLNTALLSWSVVAALSNRHFSGGFVFSVVAASALAFSMMSVFHTLFLEQSLVSSIVTTAPLVLCAVTIHRSNPCIVWKPEAGRVVAAPPVLHRRPMPGQNPKFRRRR